MKAASAATPAASQAPARAPERRACAADVSMFNGLVMERDLP
jgi:hypothetical protein